MRVYQFRHVGTAFADTACNVTTASILTGQMHLVKC